MGPVEVRLVSRQQQGQKDRGWTVSWSNKKNKWNATAARVRTQTKVALRRWCTIKANKHSNQLDFFASCGAYQTNARHHCHTYDSHIHQLFLRSLLRERCIRRLLLFPSVLFSGISRRVCGSGNLIVAVIMAVMVAGFVFAEIGVLRFTILHSRREWTRALLENLQLCKSYPRRGLWIYHARSNATKSTFSLLSINRCSPYRNTEKNTRSQWVELNFDQWACALVDKLNAVLTTATLRHSEDTVSLSKD